MLPFSGNQWLLTEVVIVPVVEGTFWRGRVFTVLLLAFRKLCSEPHRRPLTAPARSAIMVDGEG